ncbi:MAG: AMP-binding protein [Candidatus Ornithospirochaeta sp.]|nr:AMP-binding protein [Candidatus Ornithospirochaeta sp.]
MVYKTSADPFRKYSGSEVFDRIRTFETIGEMWENSVKEYGSLNAIETESSCHTFSELDGDVRHFRPLLEGLAGERIGILVPNSYDFAKVFIASSTAGCTAMILPPHLPKEAVYGISMQYGLKAVIYASAYSDKVSLLSNVRLIGAEDCSEEESEAVVSKGDDDAVIMFTGGTTGKSKGALLSHRAVMQGVANGCYGTGDVFNQRYILVLPLFHVFGLIRNLLTSLQTGSDIFICSSNKDLFRDIAVFRPTYLVAVPALAEMALTLSRKFGRNMLGPDMKYIICGSAPVPPYLVSEYRKLGITLCPGYGLTESANLVSGNPDPFSKPDSIGLPYPGQELRFEDGELWLKGRNIMKGYVGTDEESFHDGWFRTGDLVRMDDDGFLYITGRIKEIIILSNGENISPAEVEAKFNALSEIQDSQVFEDVDEGGRHFLALEVVPRMTELTDIAPESIEAYLRTKLEAVNDSLPEHQRVSRITIRTSDFERTPSMKIIRYRKCR